MQIIAHRANWEGANRSTENTLLAVHHCLVQGWGIETDIRLAPSAEFYISHDRAELTVANRAIAFCQLFRQFPSATIALNIKELGYEADLIEFLVEQQVLSQVFLFDMELLEGIPGETAEIFKRISPSVRLAARVSDRGESIDQALAIEAAKVVWLDEFDALWITKGDIEKLKSADRTVYAISPEIHGFSMEEMGIRWHQFLEWDVDGICTDYSALLAQRLSG